MIRTARIAGLWYLLLAISGVLGFLVFHPKVFVPDDPGRTLDNLIRPGSLARARLALELMIVLSQALAAAWFYKLFKEIDRWAASMLALWGTVNAMIIMVSAVSMYSAIDIAQSAAIDFEEKKPIIQLLVSIMSNCWAAGGIFFGLWLFPMGYIVIRSGRMPVWLGWILIAGGAGYLLQTFLHALGSENRFVGLLTIPATAGEFWIIGYMLLYGIRPGNNNQEI